MTDVRDQRSENLRERGPGADVETLIPPVHRFLYRWYSPYRKLADRIALERDADEKKANILIARARDALRQVQFLRQDIQEAEEDRDDWFNRRNPRGKPFEPDGL